MVHKQNIIDILGNTAIIHFYNSEKTTIIDSEDVEKRQSYCFYLESKGYAITRIGKNKMFLHHLIIGKPPKRTCCRPYKQKSFR